MSKSQAVSAMVICALGLAGPASARPPYPLLFKELYECHDPALGRVAEGAMKCNICHAVGVGKKTNDYGTALGRYLPKEKFFELKGNRDALFDALKDAFQKAELDKNSKGETFGHRLEAGLLPGE